MKRSETKAHDYLEILKSNYKQRIQEVDNFSKHFSENSLGFRSEFLTEILEISQYYIDIQKKFVYKYPEWYDENLMTKNSQIITSIWTQSIRNMDSFYSEFVDYALKNLRNVNRIAMQMLQTYERYYDMFENVPQFQRNVLIELIKEAKQHNDNYVKENLVKKSQNQRIKPKKEAIAKDSG